jgi:hypothetical protein
MTDDKCTNTYNKSIDKVVLIMFHTNSKLCFMTCFVFIVLTASISTLSAFGGGSSSPGIFLKGSTPYGIPYEDWITKWWQWNMGIPKEQHPQVNDPDLIKCPVGDSGNVSFLTHSLQGKTEYSCTIPAGNAIMIPISTGECTSDEAQSSKLADMIKCATEGDKYLTFEAVVDGVPLNGLEQNYATSDIFNITVPENNFVDLKPGQWKAGSGGYFIFLEPLPVGNHTVSISARVTNPIDPSYNFNYNTQYLLNVQ